MMQAVPALAQDAQVSSARPASDAVELDGMVVTGSRIARAELDSAMPISVIQMEQANDFGRFSLHEALMMNPAMGPGLGDTNSRGMQYDKGVANVNLRNMGANRSLVLVDGHRWVSGGARTAATDLNTIPSALIDRVETVTGGAAAIYGADAVTGAVNVVMKKRVDSTSLRLTTGLSEEGDGRQTSLSAGGGFDFADGRGHVVIGGNYLFSDDIATRDRYTQRNTYAVNPANTGPDDGIPDNIIIDFHQFYRSPYPTFCLYGGQGTCGASNGDWYQYIDGTVVNIPKDSYSVVSNGNQGTQNGGPDTAFGIYDYVLLRDKSEKSSAYANVEFALTPNVMWNTSVGLARSYSSGNAQWPGYRDDARPTNWWGRDPDTGIAHPGGVARLDDPFLPEAMRAFMQAQGLEEIRLNRHYSHLPMSREIHRRDSFTFGTDLTGPLTDRLDWSTFLRYGEVNDDITHTNMVGRQQWLAGRDAVLLDGQIVCADPAARAAGCVPFDLYSTAPVSQAWKDYALFNRYEQTGNSLLNAGFGLNGSLFDLPAGPLSVAAGVEWRQEKLRTRDDTDTAKLHNIVFSPGMDQGLHPDMDAERKVTEGYVELVVPVLADLPFARRLDVEGAWRYSDYSDNPSTDTWKAGVIWSPVEGLTVRGVKSYSTRVPNFGELFSPISVATYGHISDPCQDGRITQDKDRPANCAATVPNWTGPLANPNTNAPRVFSGGNPDLTPETSNSFSYGLVFQPRALSGFDASVDYWEIEIDNVITSLAHGTIMNNCVNASGGPDMGYCQYVHRDPVTGEVDWVQAQYANLAGRLTRGIDFSASYRFDLGPGQWRVGLNGTRLLEQRVIAQRGSQGTDYAGQWNYADKRFNLTNSFAVGDYRIALNTRYNGRTRYSISDQSDETRQMPYVPSYLSHDLNLTWAPSPRYSVALGIKNLTDARIDHPVLRDTPTSPNQSEGNNTGSAYFDAIGRYYFVTLNYDF